ncbi:MAG: adenylosuccinate synthetase, partial [Halobacteriales archaeon]|nr:adenylosuccinate synthetase [Halobacteriales archaeon]
FVTSSNPTAGYAATGTGLGPTVIGQGEVIGVVKAYLSRVGTGPLPTELEGDLADEIRERGGEFGTVTGRPRRIGWLDMPMLRHAARANGFTGLAINHLDVLAGMETLQVAHSYTCDGETLVTMPPTTEEWGRCTPTYREFDGWPTVDWAAVADAGYAELPPNAKDYVEYVAAELDADIVALGVGPNRGETIIRRNPFD